MNQIINKIFASISHIASVILIVIFFTGCNQEEDYITGDPRPSTTTYTSTSNCMFINASPGAKSPLSLPLVVNYAVNNLTVNNTAMPPVPIEFSYLGNPTYRGTLATPQTQIRFTNKADQSFVSSANLNIVLGRSYSIFLIDSTTRAAGRRTLSLEDNLAAPASGKAHIRFLHFAPNAPEVKVVNNTGMPAEPAVVFSPRKYAELSRRSGSTTTNFNVFTAVDAGTYDYDVRINSTDATNNQSVLPLNGVVLVAGKIYTVYARGFVSGVGEQALGATIIQHN